jgi:hypothetical protein
VFKVLFFFFANFYVTEVITAMARFQKELEWAHINGLISGSERAAALELVKSHPDELTRQLAFIKGINRFYLRLIDP